MVGALIAVMSAVWIIGFASTQPRDCIKKIDRFSLRCKRGGLP